jgi:hypothetical protein
MQPSEALSASAQVAVTLAGFAGVVVAFRSGSVHEWSKLDRFRLRILLFNSAMPFVMSIVGLLLATTTLDAVTTWRWCSLCTFVLMVLMSRSMSRGFRDFSREEFKLSGGRSITFYGASLLGVGATLLQLGNVIWLKTFWAFFAAIAIFLILAMAQFILLVFAGSDQPS